MKLTWNMMRAYTEAARRGDRPKLWFASPAVFADLAEGGVAELAPPPKGGYPRPRLRLMGLTVHEATPEDLPKCGWALLAEGENR